MSEILKPIPLSELEVWLIAIGSIPVLAMAFSSLVRKIIFKRDGGRSVWSGKEENLHAAHITHDRSDPRYNDSSNGRMLTRAEHYVDHDNRQGRNGLTERGNSWAKTMLWNSMSEEEREEVRSGKAKP